MDTCLWRQRMGLFGRSDISLFTAEGIKKLYQFFILNFCIYLFQIVIIVVILLGFSTGLSGIIFSVISSTFFVALIWILEILIILWLFWAFTDLVIGRKEFDKHYEIMVIIASAFLIPSIFLYLIQLILSKGLAVSAAAFYFNPSGNLAELLPQGSLLLAISVVLPIMMGISLFLFVYRFSDQTEKVPLLFACGLLVTSPFTMYVTALISYFLFFAVYRSVYHRLLSTDYRRVEKVPCPFCNKEIPMESNLCPYCNTEFKQNKDAELDPLFKVNIEQRESLAPQGFTPVKGPTEYEKKRLFKIIYGIIAIVIIVVVVYAIIRAL